MTGKSGFGKNNFDRLEAAGLVANGEDATAAMKVSTAKRIEDLRSLAAKITKVEAEATKLYVLSKPQRLKRLTSIIKAVKELHASTLPVGTKKQVTACLNELVSLREGIYASNSEIDKKALMLIAASSARKEVENMITASEARLEKIVADSSNSSDMEDFYKNAADVIEKHQHEGEKLAQIKTKPFVVSRVPIVPADGNISAEKLNRLGISAESLGGYPVIHNQIVIGISPKALLGEHAGSLKSEKTAKAVRQEADRLRKLVEKKVGQKLQFVSDNARSYGSGVWFWVMPNKELDMMSKAAAGHRIKVQRWGFAFNS